MYVIDPPTNFDTREMWERFLEEIRLLLVSESNNEELKKAEKEALSVLNNRDHA